MRAHVGGAVRRVVEALVGELGDLGQRGVRDRDGGGAPRERRYSSRADAWSSGKPSKPSACANRTTVELDVLARRASSSAVWNDASSRWSTMYWPTSFCERENSSKRWRISAERVRAEVEVRATAMGFARRLLTPAGFGRHHRPLSSARTRIRSSA